MPKKITLPTFLKKRLEESEYDAVVGQALKDFGRWFADESKQTFFPDYTNHGIQHIEQVLNTATNLIPEKAREYFSANDAAALVLAVLLHDSALHISKAGFRYLIKGPKEEASPYVPVARFDQADWGQAWSDFMFLARRWDDQMLLNVFGPDEESGAPRAQVRDPFDHWSNLSETDELLIGEFIRKHHPRLAHEMALHGVPGKDVIHLQLTDDLPLPWRDLVGLIARSHGLPLRTSVDYLRQTPHFGSNGQRGYQNVHAIYLMALLRVADYVQIQGDRTSERIFTFKDIPSLLSRVEHKVHNAEVLISDDAEDPESLQIDASPKEVAVFLRLKEWLAGIQQELDGSWAVLGEVYGRYPKLKKLGLAFRRVRSNLDNVAEFAKTVPYVPDRIRFDVARAELLKLLIGPLYGDDPSYGVRELMQNAIDAVREYDQFVLDNPEYANVPRREQEADVVVELGPFDEAKGYAVMTISDRGIGMTEETIRDYFLRAGASYRQNPHWKSVFESDSMRGAKSKVMRSGRFGVGALSAFLIGEEIEVETRYIRDEEGYSFKTYLSTEAIELRKKPDFNIGTIVKVTVNAITYGELIKSLEKTNRPNRWDWYCGAYPSVVRKLPRQKGGFTKLQNSFRLSISEASENWRELFVQLPYKVYWTCDESPSLTCNNIFISNASSVYSISNQLKNIVNIPIELNFPNIAIVDNDGRFPLNIQRDGLRENRYEFGLELIHDVFTEALAWFFYNGPRNPVADMHNMVNFRNSASAAIREAIVVCSSGYAISLVTILRDYPIRHVFVQSRDGFMLNPTSDDYLIFASDFIGGFHSFVRLHVEDALSNDKTNDVQVRKVLYNDSVLTNKANTKPTALQKRINLPEESGYKIEFRIDDWSIIASKGCPVLEFDISSFPKSPPRSKHHWYPAIKTSSFYGSAFMGPTRRIQEHTLIEERFYPSEAHLKAVSKPWLLDELWQEHFGKNWIPFALEDRLAKFPQAAKFFAERYPQVVPDEAWKLLGDKPA